MKRLEKGFSAVEIVLVVVIVVVVAFVGWRVWEASQTPAAPSDTNNQSQQSDTVPAINNEQDLDDASKQLDNADVGDGYEKEVENQTNY